MGATVTASYPMTSNMNTKNYLKKVYMSDPGRITIRMAHMGEKINGLMARADHNAHVKSDADHDYITLDVPEEQLGRIYAPVSGRLVPSELAAKNSLTRGAEGRCVCIAPSSGTLYSPVTGRITMQLPSHNALGIMTFDGIQLVITIGNTPERYAGRAFRQMAWQNDSVHLGDPLIAWDRQRLHNEGQEDLVTMVVTNPQEFGGVELEEVHRMLEQSVRHGDLVMSVLYPEEG